MGLSSSPEYLAKRGVRAQGGPRDGQYLDDSGLLWRTIDVSSPDEPRTGFYHLKGGPEGTLVYVWADLE